MRFRATAAVCLIAMYSAADAQEPGTTVKALIDDCNVYVAVLDGTAAQKYGAEDINENALGAGRCAGYIQGFLGGYSVGRNAPDSISFCLPEGVTNAQVASLLIRRLEGHPEFEHVNQMAALVGVLNGTWPCSPTSN